MKQAVALLLAVALCLSVCALASGIDAWVLVESATALPAKPEATATVVKEVPKGAELDYLGKSQDGKWYKVKWKNYAGWIDAKHASVKWSTIY